MSGAPPSDDVELFVKAGKDGVSNSGCPLCQRLFMILLMKAKLGTLKLTVTTINMAKPPPDFKKVRRSVVFIFKLSYLDVKSSDIVSFLRYSFYPVLGCELGYSPPIHYMY